MTPRGTNKDPERALPRFQQNYVRVLMHDLQKPLQVIASATVLMRRAAEDGDQRAACRLEETILGNVDAMAKALRELVQCDALEHGACLDKRVLDVRTLVLQALKLGVAPAEQDRIEIDAAADLPKIEADEQKLQRAFLNLVHNALKFSPARCRVRIRITARMDTVILTVHDAGPGITRAEAEKLFRKYRASHQSKRSGGTGLGLYGCRLIVRAHGGRCRVESCPGKGSIFAIELPATCGFEPSHGADS